MFRGRGAVELERYVSCYSKCRLSIANADANVRAGLLLLLLLLLYHGKDPVAQLTRRAAREPQTVQRSVVQCIALTCIHSTSTLPSSPALGMAKKQLFRTE